MFEVDANIVAEITSYLVLHKMCYDAVAKEKIPERNLPTPEIPTNTFNLCTVVQIPLLWQLYPLICKSSLIVSMYPMLISSSEGNLHLVHFSRRNLE